MPRLSVIIPAYNAEPYLRRAVESLRATSERDMEVLIVDDGSRDRTLEVAWALAAEDPQMVRVLTHPGGGNRGVSETRNVGLRASTGDWLAFLDADDYVYPHRFDSAREILTARPDVDGVHQLCEIVYADEAARAASRCDQPWMGFGGPIAPDELIFALLGGMTWATSAIVVRRFCLDRAGLFDPNLKIAEDCHLWFRVASTSRIVSGDLSRPVSAYWRHLDSAYQPDPKLRIDMIRAMARFGDWLSRTRPGDPRRDAIADRITQYILHGVIEARKRGERDWAWRLAWRSAALYPRVATYRRWYGLVTRMAVGR